MKKKIFAILDFRCKDIAALAAGYSKTGEIIAEDFVIGQSGGIHRSAVTDMNKAADSIGAVVDKLSAASGAKIRDIYVVLSASSVALMPSGMTVLLSRYGREVTDSDVAKCVRAASFMKMPLEKEPLETIVRSFSVDGEKGIMSPVGIEGMKLSVDIDVVAVDSFALRNTQKAAALAGMHAEGFVFSPIAYAKRVIDADDTEKEVCLFNICPEMTEVSVFKKNIMKACVVLAHDEVGGLLGEDREQASRSLKRVAGKVISLGILDETQKVIVTGDMALKEDVIELLETYLSKPVVPATCAAKASERLPEKRWPFTGCLGAVDHLKSKRRVRSGSVNPVKRITAKAVHFLGKYF